MLLYPLQLKCFYFLFFILKGSDPSIATMALFTAKRESLREGLSSSVPFTLRNLGHEQIGGESKLVVIISSEVLVLFLSISRGF